MIILGLETSCDETGIALYDVERGLLGHVLHSQISLHSEYGGVVPELASRDHIRWILPLIKTLLEQTQLSLKAVSAVAYTQGPGLAGALLTGASVGASLAYALGIPAVAVHHLEGHLLSPLLSHPAPTFPFVALLVSGGHTQLMRVESVGHYQLLGETADDAAGEAFDKTAKLLGLGYPGGQRLEEMARTGKPGKFRLPRPMLHSGDLNFSFSGLKTAVALLINQHGADKESHADIALAFEEAVTDVLVAKSIAALKMAGLRRLVVAGGVGANTRLRQKLVQQMKVDGAEVFFPELTFCTDNGAMIALAGALRLQHAQPLPKCNGSFSVKARWPLAEITG